MDLGPGAARDTTGFTDAVRGGYLPNEETITYCGVFSENRFSTGPKEREMTCNVEIECGQYGDESYMGLYLKSKCDGEPRGPKPIDVAILLDTSGSMGNTVGGDPNNPESRMTRLALCKVALKKLINNLRPNDRIGLAEFKTKANILFPVTYVKDVEKEVTFAAIDTLNAGGGTTVPAGMDCGTEMLTGIKQDSNEERECRLIFLTDMGTMGREELKGKLQFAADKQIYTSVVGIGINFNAELTEMITKVTGANYFCITKGADIQKRLVDEFHWNFFPCSFNVRLQIQSGDFTVVDMYGTPFDTFNADAKELRSGRKTSEFYPQDFRDLLQAVEYATDLSSETCGIIVDFFYQPLVTINDIDTVFPSFAADDGRTEGGLILLKLKPENSHNCGRLRVHLTSIVGETGKRETIDEIVDIAHPVYSGSGLHKGIVLQRYAETCRALLKKRESDEKTQKTLKYMENEMKHFSEEDQAELMKTKESLEKLIKLALD